MPYIDIVVVTRESQPVIERLLQLYEYDASEFFEADVADDGLYHVMDAATLWHPDYHVFLITVAGNLAGFAFVTRHASYVVEGTTWLIDEFFVMRKHRRRGVGERAARTLFDRFPGRWEVGQLPANRPAQAFWRATIGRHTREDFRETHVDTDRWRGPVQSFDSTARAARAGSPDRPRSAPGVPPLTGAMPVAPVAVPSPERARLTSQIRPFGRDDLDAVIHLSLLAWAPVFASFREILGPKIYAIVYPDWRAQQREAVEKACADGGHTAVWVADVDGAVVGFIAYILNHETKTGVVDLLAVHPDYQNRGIGTALNTFALAQMKASGMILADLHTGGDPGHAPARQSYEKAGYTALPLVHYSKDL